MYAKCVNTLPNVCALKIEKKENTNPTDTESGAYNISFRGAHRSVGISVCNNVVKTQTSTN